VAKFINFDEIQSQTSSSTFLRVKPDCKLKVRLVSDAVKVVKVFNKHRVCAVLDSEEIGMQLRAKYPKELSNVSVRYVSWCIDRDSKSMKILDMPKSVAISFSDRQIRVGKKIAEYNEGCDWMIMTNGKQGKEVRYEVVYLEDTILSKAEIELIEDQKTEKYGHYDLTKIFKSLSFEEAEKKLFNA